MAIKYSSTARRRTTGVVLGALASLALTVCAAGTATAQPASSGSAASANPYAPNYQHPYRHGAVPTIPGLAKMHSWQSEHAASASAAATGPQTLTYGGGTNTVGVTSGGKPKVYLVFYGTQWGTSSTNTNGDLTFSGDPDGGAPAAQELFKGLGTGGELWSGVMTQYCDGSAVATGASSCPTGAAQEVYPTGGALAGVWYDNTAASPSSATGHQLGVEAVNAAAHFGNTTAASNRDAYYVILSPHGTNPDNYQSLFAGYCAWHDFTGDTTLNGGAVTSSYGPISFSNQPYNMDVGATCGVGFYSSPGTLDGYTITLGHEFAENVTDMDPPVNGVGGGWTNHSGTGQPNNGQENGDECAWIKAGSPGGVAPVSTAHGSFVMQSTWSNDTNSCAMSHPIVTGGTGGGNTVTVSSPGNQSGTVGTAVSLQVAATDSASGQTLTYSASGLPTGLSISSGGLISGTPTAAGTYSVTVTATDSTGAAGSASFTWTVTAVGGGCNAAQLLGNPGFETGSGAPWTGTTGSIVPSFYGEPAHSGSYVSWLDGYWYPATDTLAQAVTIPSTCKNATFSFWRHIDTYERTTTAADDKLTVQVLNSSGVVVATLHVYSNLDANTGYRQESFSLNQFIGQKVTVKFTATETDVNGGTTDFVIDDTALNVS